MKIAQSPKTPLQSALQQLKQGEYYAARTDEVLGKAERALDGFVGAAMNISLDNEERNVSRQGQELSQRIRKGDRYLKRGEVNQSAYNKALLSGTESLELAVRGASTQADKQVLSQALTDLQTISGDTEVETKIAGIKSQLTDEAQSRLREVEKDEVGRNVSEHGRPVWNIFENSMVEIDSTQGLAKSEKAALGDILERLRVVEGRT